MSPLRVSVVMSVYDGEKHLKEAIESILNQTFRDFEFIIVDDGSTDGTWEILTSYEDPRVVLLRNEQNLGLARSLNKALERAKGEYIARQDADDISLPARLTRQMEYLWSHRHVGLLGTAYHVIDVEGHRVATHQQPLTDTEIRWQMLFHNAFCHTSVIFRRELLDRSESPYDEDLRYGQDYELWARLLGHTRAANLPEPLVAFRKHEASASATARAEQQRTASAVAARQIKNLVAQLQLTQYEVNSLRDWYYRLPDRLSTEDMALCRVPFRILNALERRRDADRTLVCSLRRCWIARILNAVSVAQLRELLASGLLGSMLREDTASVAAHMCKRALRHMTRVLCVVLGMWPNLALTVLVQRSRQC